MITVTTDGETHTVDAIIRGPSIYLDHWALRHFSSDLPSRQRLVECFKQKGTLLFSWANVLEVSQNSGASLEEVRSFLNEIGEQWFPIEINAVKVIERERNFTAGNDNPCFASDFLKAYYPHISGEPPSLRTVCDLPQDSEINLACRENLEKIKKEIRPVLFRWRSEELENHGHLRFEPNRPTGYVLERFRRLFQKETFTIDENDVLDFLHATVSVSYGDFVLLDKHWVDLVGKLKLPPDRVKVYSPKYVEAFLKDLERFQFLD